MPQIHPFAPVYDERCTTLVLGSFPSEASKAAGFYYGHPRNRFWSVMAALFSQSLPGTVGEKTELLLKNGVALWDILASCTIKGSADASIRSAIPNDIGRITAQCPIGKVLCNGRAAYSLYQKHITLDIPVAPLPSTSPANAAYTLERLVNAWRAQLFMSSGTRI